MKRFKKLLCSKKKATGGLTLIIVSVIGALSLNWTTRLSSEDLSRSICDQSAHFVTFKAASYLNNANAPSGTYTHISDSNGNYINFAAEYSRFLTSGFEGKCGITNTFTIYWDKSTKEARTVNVGAVDTMLNGDTVSPEQQRVIIE